MRIHSHVSPSRTNAETLRKSAEMFLRRKSLLNCCLRTTRFLAITLLLISATVLAGDRVEPREPPTTTADLSAVIIPTTGCELIIDLGSAMRLAEEQNPRIAQAREVVNEAIAQRKGARALLLPSLAAGGNYHLHTGVVQTAWGQIRSLTEQSLYLGGGAGAVGSGTVMIPAVRIFAPVGDAYYLPLAASQTVTARAFDSHAVDNVTLLDVADRYLTLLAAEARREILQVSLREVNQIEEAQKTFMEVGQGRDADYHRARADLLLLQLDEQQAQEDAAVAAAELSRLLHLDPSVRLVTPPGPIELLELVDESTSVEELVERAMRQRPEVSSRTAEICAAEYRLRNEIVRPWLPQITAGFSGGAYGGGSNRVDLGVPNSFMSTEGRTDFDVMALWTFQNLGVGNAAIQGGRKSEREQAVLQRALALAQIRREVTDRRAQAQARHRTLSISWTQLSSAERGAEQELRRTRAGEALPLESLNSALLLANARQQLLAAVIEYDRAELRLLVALGISPTVIDAQE